MTDKFLGSIVNEKTSSTSGACSGFESSNVEQTMAMAKKKTTQQLWALGALYEESPVTDVPAESYINSLK